MDCKLQKHNHCYSITYSNEINRPLYFKIDDHQTSNTTEYFYRTPNYKQPTENFNEFKYNTITNCNNYNEYENVPSPIKNIKYYALKKNLYSTKTSNIKNKIIDRKISNFPKIIPESPYTSKNKSNIQYINYQSEMKIKKSKENSSQTEKKKTKQKNFFENKKSNNNKNITESNNIPKKINLKSNNKLKKIMK